MRPEGEILSKKTSVSLCVLYASALFFFSTLAASAEPPPDYTSRVPRFTFGTALEEQEKQLKENPLMARFAASRTRMANDPYRPLYHFVSPEGNLNDPNGLCFWQGRWHLFYQGYPPEDPRQHWGHAVSDDLIRWRDLPYAIYPNPEEKCYSGATLVEEDRVIAMYHGTKVGNMVAVSTDPLLLNWEKVTGKAVIPMNNPDGSPRPYRIFDPCVWRQGDFYYALSGGTQPTGPGGKTVPLESLFRSKDLATWEYLHPFVESDRFTRTGDDGACPYFWPVGDRHILLFFSHTSGGQYLLGDYDTRARKFNATAHGKFNHGPVGPGGVHAPSAAPDGQGGVISIFNVNPAKGTRGWNQVMTLPMRLTLRGKEELGIEPAGDIEALRFHHRRAPPQRIPPNQETILPDIRGNAVEIAAEIDLSRAQTVELLVLRSPGREEYTRIALYRERGYRAMPWDLVKRAASAVVLDNACSSALPDMRSRLPDTAQLFLDENEPFKLRIFIDRSLVEVFVNGRQYLACRVYPGLADSTGVSLRAQGGEALLKSLDVWQMKGIYERGSTNE
jgi:beta-fructofuranosidase